MPRKKTTEEFKKDLAKISPNLELLSEYNGSLNYVTVRCKIHDYTYQSKPKWLMKGMGCQKCYDDRRGEKTRKPIDKVIEDARKVHGGKYDYSLIENYKNSKQKVPIICPVHGVFYSCMNKHVISKQGCPKCANKHITTEEWIERAKMVHGAKYDYSKVEYVNNTTPITIVCPIHGEFRQTPDKHTQGHGCQICNESSLERRIRNILLGKSDLCFNAQQRFDWLNKQSLDFYVNNSSTGIECQGIQHLKYGVGNIFKTYNQFMTILHRDILKNRLCKENGIKLLYIINERDKDLANNPIFEGIYNDSNLLTIEEIEKNNSILLDKLYL